MKSCEQCGKSKRRRPRRPNVPRPKSYSRKSITRAALAEGAAIYPPIDVDRPKTRGDCIDGQRPCPWVGCEHHTYLDINPATGSIRISFPHLEPWELAETCALDVADRGPQTLEMVGGVLNVTRERTRQLEVRGLFNLKQSLVDRGVLENK